MRRLALVLTTPLVAAGIELTVAQPTTTPPERFDESRLVTIEGTVTRVERPLATLEFEGGTCKVRLGPVWYWQQQGYALSEGDQVTVTGQLSGQGKGVIDLHRLVRGDETYRFVDQDGVPLWASRAHDPGWTAGGRGPCLRETGVRPHAWTEEGDPGCWRYGHAARRHQD